MKITFLLPGFPSEPIGGYKVVYSYANFLAARGHEVTVLQSYFIEGGRSRRRGLRHFLVATKYNWRKHRRPSWFNLNPEVTVLNSLYLRAHGFRESGVVIATAVETAALVARVSAASGALGVYFIQHFEAWSSDEQTIIRTWNLPLLRVVIAPWLAKAAADHDVQTILVPNAIDPNEFPEGPAIESRSTDVLALVSDHQWKRTDLVIEAFRVLESRIPGFKAHTFGACPRPKGLPASVSHYESPEPSLLRSLYQNSKIYMCASDAEGWHLPPAEAMSAGAAIVSTDIDGVRAYADGVAHFVQKGSSASLAAGVESLLTNPEECQRLATAGHARMGQYTPEDAGALFETVIRQNRDRLVDAEK